MALYTGHVHAENVRATYRKFRNLCLFEGGSLFSADSLWTQDNVSELKNLYLQNPLAGSRNFYRKLEIQLLNTTPSVKKLASEVLWLLLLFPLEKYFSREAKIERVKTLWQYSGEAFPTNEFIQNDALRGLANPGPAFLTLIWAEFKYLLRVLDATFDMEPESRRELYTEEPWAFGEWLDSFEDSEGRAFRHMFAYLNFPEHYERICSKTHKKDIVEAFEEKIGPIDVKAKPEIDQKLYRIRLKLEADYSKSIDFYLPPLRKLWHKKDEWAEDEIDEIIPVYFEMLAEEVAGREYNKTHYRNLLRQKIERSAGSLEFKFQNISAVLQDLGFRFIQGYKPRKNYQGLLAESVEQFLDQDGGFQAIIDRVSEEPKSLHNAQDIFVKKPDFSKTKSEKNGAIKARLVRKYDPALRDALNRELGRKGEEFVFNLEKDRLSRAGREDLANLVQWISRDKGDGAGYDIESFDLDGRVRFVEVKTTKGNETVPFFITHNELAVSREAGESYILYRVFNFEFKPKIFVIMGQLDEALELQPISYRARSK